LRSPALRDKLRDERGEAELGEAKPRPGGAKTMTNNLPILSVLGGRAFYLHPEAIQASCHMTISAPNRNIPDRRVASEVSTFLFLSS
jgi:hypothetical protein